MSSFRDIAMENVKHDETLHKATTMESNNKIVESILSAKEVEDLNVNVDKVEKHEYKTEKNYSVTAPLEKTSDSKEEYLLAVFNGDTDAMEKIRIMFIEYDGKNTKVGFSYIDGSSKVAGVYSEDMDLIRIEQDDSSIQPMDVSQCLKDVFDSLPWWLRAVCTGACASCFGLNPIGCSACAGCIGGTALDCI